MAVELSVLALQKAGGEWYVVVYDDDSVRRVVDTFRDWAADPEHLFDACDADIMINRLLHSRQDHND